MVQRAGAKGTLVGGILFALTFLACSPTRDAATGETEGPEIVDGGAVFHFYDADAKRVYLVGDFNNWSPSADPMKDENGDGNWKLFYPLPPGVYQYKFVVDGKWISDARNPLSEPDGFGKRNSVVKIPAGSGAQ